MTTINKVPTIIVEVLDSPNEVNYNIKIVKKDAVTGEEIMIKISIFVDLLCMSVQM